MSEPSLEPQDEELCFQGVYEYTLDEKNRVVLPASLRKCLDPDVLKRGFTVTIGTNARFLELHPRDSWVQWVRDMRTRYDRYDARGQEFIRDVLGSAYEVVPDRNYRFVIPEASKTEAAIDREVVFVGMWDRIELWDRERWLARKRERAGRQEPPPRSAASDGAAG